MGLLVSVICCSFGSSAALFCHAATVQLGSRKVLAPRLTPSHIHPAPKHEVGALFSPLLDLK